MSAREDTMSLRGMSVPHECRSSLCSGFGSWLQYVRQSPSGLHFNFCLLDKSCLC